MNLPQFLIEATADDLQELIDHFHDIEGMIDGAFYEWLGEDTIPDELPELTQASISIMNLRHAITAQHEQAIADEEEAESDGPEDPADYYYDLMKDDELTAEIMAEQQQA